MKYEKVLNHIYEKIKTYSVMKFHLFVWWGKHLHTFVTNTQIWRQIPNVELKQDFTLLDQLNKETTKISVQ